ncbi:MAG: pyridine nucleotide-disulfide oxidoreductase [Gemmatimonas sp.]|nr:pyridine nucleotide-disulfide oxidoreductase [Gemmatimonas sp.]
MSSREAEGPAPKLVLIGGGHAHLHVLLSLATERWPPLDVTLLAPEPTQLYTGMVPGYLYGRYRLEELAIDLEALCGAAGAVFRQERANVVDGDARLVETAEGPIPFEVASLDVGSVPRGADLPGVRDHAASLRPLAAVVDLRDRLDRLAGTHEGRSVRVVVVGGGAGGIEVCLAVNRRLEQRGARGELVIVDGSDAILPGFPARARQKAGRAVTGVGGRWRLGSDVLEVEPRVVQLASGEQIACDLPIWVTGAAPHCLLSKSSLPLSPDGFFEVDQTLRSSDGSPVWGAGDCVDLQARRLPKAGVFAVRQGPVLAYNLRAALSGHQPRPYHPQTNFLSLLDTADGRAILRRGSLVLHNRLAMRIKERIDRRFVRRLQRIGSSAEGLRHPTPPRDDP